jgi:hypothetical protein
MRYTLLAKATLVMTFLVVAFVIPKNIFADYVLPAPTWGVTSAGGCSGLCFSSLDISNSIQFTSEPTEFCNSGIGGAGTYVITDPTNREITVTLDFSGDAVSAGADINIASFITRHGDGEYFYFSANLSGCYGASSGGGYTFFSVEDGELFYNLDPFDNTTRIISTTPYNNELTSTSTAFLFNVTGFINAEDIQSNIRIRYAYRTLLGDVVNYTFGSDISNEEMISFTATTSGNFNLSATTSVLEIGRYTGRWTIEKPTFSVFGFEFGVQTLYSTTTFFTVATTTNYDNYLAEQSTFLQYLGSEYAGVSCEGITEFFTNLGYCVYGLFVPNADQMIAIWTNFREGFLTKAPWGYGVRVYDIFVGNTATSSLIGLNLSIPVELGLPVAGATINFDPWGTLNTALDTLGTDVPVNGTEPILDTMLFYWNLFVSLAFAWWLVNFVLHHGQHPEDPHKWDEEKKQAHTPSRNTRYDRDQKIL